VDPRPKRRRAVVVLLLMLVLAAATVEIAVYLGGRPTCAAIRSGSAALTVDRKCFDGSSSRETLVEVLAVVAALAALAGAYGAWRVLERGGDERRTALIASVALVLGGLALLAGSI
jgi:hypothetical protein